MPATRLLKYVAFAVLFIVGMQLAGCSAPTRAKVVSLEKSTKKTQTRARSSYSYHRVRKGDTLYTIAWRYGLHFPELARWNNIGSPYTIYPGQSLRLFRSARKSKRTAPITSVKTKPKKPVETGKPKAKASRPPVPKSAAAGYTGRKRLAWRWPTSGKLKQRFAKGDPGRKGIEISGSTGQRVVAAESGKVVYAGSGLIGYGRLIIIKHNKNYLSAYGHNRKLLVKEGAVVKKGKPVAEMGRKGGGRPTLHFEIRKNGAPVNPIKLLPRRR